MGLLHGSRIAFNVSMHMDIHVDLWMEIYEFVYFAYLLYLLYLLTILIILTIPTILTRLYYTYYTILTILFSSLLMYAYFTYIWDCSLDLKSPLVSLCIWTYYTTLPNGIESYSRVG